MRSIVKERVLSFQFLVLIASTLGVIALFFLLYMAHSLQTFTGSLTDSYQMQDFNEVHEELGTAVDNRLLELVNKAWASLAKRTFAWEAAGPSAAIDAIWVVDPGQATTTTFSRSGTGLATLSPGQDWLPALAVALSLKKTSPGAIPEIVSSPGRDFRRVEMHRLSVAAKPQLCVVETQATRNGGRTRGILFSGEALHREFTARFLRLFCRSNQMAIHFQDSSGGQSMWVAGESYKGNVGGQPERTGELVADQTIRSGILSGGRVRVYNRLWWSHDFTRFSWVYGGAVILLIALSLAYFIRRIGAKEAELSLRNDWITNLAHSLRGPTHAAGLLGEALAGECGADRANLGTLLKAQLEHMDRTCRRFIRLAKAGHHRLVVVGEPVEILPVMKRVLERVLVRYPRHDAERIPMGVPAGLRVMADPDALDEIIEVALDNALKYSPKGTPVSLSAGEIAGRVIITVRDQGLGVPPAQLSRIGEPFFRATEQESEGIVGTGLGIYLAQNLCDKMNAEYSLRSEGLGKGCEATISMPGAAA